MGDQHHEISLRIELLDLQLVDRDSLPIGRVDDVELETHDPGVARVTTLLSGQAALGERLGGVVGGILSRLAHRLTDGSQHEPGLRLSLDDVADWGSVLTLRVRFDDLPGAGLERWLARRVVRHIPGSGS